jgi:glucose/mannose-6-phosphate isomerase
MLDDPATFERVDPHDARRVLAGFPAQCRNAVRLRPTPALAMKAPRLVVVAGMGGSAAGGDLLAACGADRLDVPVLVHRGYGLPALAG